MSTKPTKAQLNKVVLSMRHLLALASDPRGRLRDEQRMHAKVTKLCDVIARRTGMAVADVWAQVETHARKLGAVTPLPGRDM